MNKLNTIGLIALILGIVSVVLGYGGFPDPIGGGYMSFVGYVLIIIGIILFVTSWMKNNK